MAQVLARGYWVVVEQQTVSQVAYLILVGHIPENISGVGARGYHVYRRHTVVHVAWGRIGTVQRRAVGFIWKQTPVRKIHKCWTVRRAKAKRQELIDEQLAQGYRRLPPGQPIQPKSLSRGE